MTILPTYRPSGAGESCTLVQRFSGGYHVQSHRLGALSGSYWYICPHRVAARDDGRFANSPLKQWFDRLASGKGLCCSFADGVSVEDVDWDTRDGHYRVRLHGQWIVVPERALVTEPNRFGPAVVWPYQDTEGATQIRFIPGAGT